MPDSSDYPNVAAVEYDDTFSTVTVTLHATSENLEDMFLPLVVGTPAYLYQSIAGQDVSTHVVVLGSDGSTLDGSVFPDDYKDLLGESDTSSAAGDKVLMIPARQRLARARWC